MADAISALKVLYGAHAPKGGWAEDPEWMTAHGPEQDPEREAAAVAERKKKVGGEWFGKLMPILHSKIEVQRQTRAEAPGASAKASVTPAYVAKHAPPPECYPAPPQFKKARAKSMERKKHS